MRQIVVLLIIIVSCFYPKINFSQQELSQFMPNALSIGMGGSGVALSHDPAANYWNPASIAFLITNRVLFNLNDESKLDYIGLTRFFPPSLSLGINIWRYSAVSPGYDMATIAIGYRLSSFLSIGTNLNFGKSAEDENYSSFGLGFFFKSFPNYHATQNSDNFFWRWFRSKQMKDKFAFGITFHNIPIHNEKKNQEIRVGTAIKPLLIGPSIHFAYHYQPSNNKYSLHLGSLTALSKHTELYFGVRDLDINQFALGGALQLGPFQMDLSYDFKFSKVYFSLIIRLSEEKNTLFQKYKDLGTQRIKQNDYCGALNTYLKALAYEPENEELNYLISIVEREATETSEKIDSLFTNATRFEKKGWYISAFISYQKILEIDRDNRKAQRRLNSLDSKLTPYISQLYRQGVRHYNQNDLRHAEIIFEQILLVDGNHNGAEIYLAKIDSINSNTANEHYYRGLGYYNQKNLARAQQEFKNALNVKSNHEQAQQYLKTTEREIENNRRMMNQYLREAKNYEQKKQYVNATLCYRKILEIDKMHQYAKDRLTFLDGYIKTEVDNKFRRAKSLYDRMEYSEAIELFKDILSIDPNHQPSKGYLRSASQRLNDLAEQHYQRAQSFFRQKKWDIALQECNLTLSMNPDHHAATELQRMALANISIDKLLEKGIRYFERGDYLSAKSIFRQVLDKEPLNASARNYLERIESQLKDIIEELFNIGMVKYADGDYEGAIKEWTSVIEIDSHHESAKEYIQKAKERIDALKRIKQ